MLSVMSSPFSRKRQRNTWTAINYVRRKHYVGRWAVMQSQNNKRREKLLTKRETMRKERN
jgi:hypothetical protein